MNALILQVQQALERYPDAGDLYVFRGKHGDPVKIFWHDGIGMSFYAKRLERGQFIWPAPTQGVVSISAAQLGYRSISKVAKTFNVHPATIHCCQNEPETVKAAF